MTLRFTWWQNLAVYFASIVLACIVSLFYLTSSFNAGRGAAYYVVIIAALLFRMMIESIVKRALKK